MWREDLSKDELASRNASGGILVDRWTMSWTARLEDPWLCCSKFTDIGILTLQLFLGLY